MQPTVFYQWQKESFENRAAAFEQKPRQSHSADQERIAQLAPRHRSVLVLSFRIP
jgi:hypothetical protein